MNDLIEIKDSLIGLKTAIEKIVEAKVKDLNNIEKEMEFLATTAVDMDLERKLSKKASELQKIKEDINNKVREYL